MLRPRSWWEAKFAQHSANVNREMLWAMQDKSTRHARRRPPPPPKHTHTHTHKLTPYNPDRIHSGASWGTSAAVHAHRPQARPCSNLR